MSRHKATFYAQARPKFGKKYNGLSHEWEDCVNSFTVTAVTQKRPAQATGTVVVKLSVEIPDAAFLPLMPETLVVVPDHLTDTGPVEVEAEDPRE